jgi:hypothetical protein
MNGDGKPDIVISNQTLNTVSVFLNETAPGATAPTLGTRMDFATGLSPASVVTADINGDGKPDLIVPNFGGNTVSVFLNTTAAGQATVSFAPRLDFVVGAGPTAVAIGDFNGDGVPDLAVANNGSSTVSVLLGHVSR